MDKDYFQNKIFPILEYIGAIGAFLMIIAYIITVFVMIIGFEVKDFLQTSIFAIVNAVVGFIIMQFMKIQGVSFAKNIPENKELLKNYYNTKTKGKKARPIIFFWFTSVIKDLFSKVLTLAISTIGVVYIVVQGSKDYNLLLLAGVNLIMFVCFGMLSLNSAFEYYNNSHIPYIKEKLKEKESNDKV